MFQFPGFALLTLCIQVKSTWLTPLLITPKGNNNRVSGGFPHSEIHGSKLILSSPWLIAEYHVLHRLLLPRHPPNALFALDLIQKEQNSFRSKVILFLFVLSLRCLRTCIPKHQTDQQTAVSVLDLEQNCLRARSTDDPSHGPSAVLMFLSKRCQSSSDWTAQCPKALNGQIIKGDGGSRRT
jgi:hypothetical protein